MLMLNKISESESDARSVCLAGQWVRISLCRQNRKEASKETVIETIYCRNVEYRNFDFFLNSRGFGSISAKA